MDKNLKEASNSKSQKKEKAPTFRVQTGIRAGGFYDWWQGVAEGWNERDRATGLG